MQVCILEFDYGWADPGPGCAVPVLASLEIGLRARALYRVPPPRVLYTYPLPDWLPLFSAFPLICKRKSLVEVHICAGILTISLYLKEGGSGSRGCVPTHPLKTHFFSKNLEALYRSVIMLLTSTIHIIRPTAGCTPVICFHMLLTSELCVRDPGLHQATKPTPNFRSSQRARLRAHRD